MHITMKLYKSIIALLFSFTIVLYSQSKQPLTFEDVMKFKQIKSPGISRHGNWISFEARPDRGNGEAVIKSTHSETTFKFERGYKAELSKNEKWVSINLKPDFAESEKSKEKPKDDLLIFNIADQDSLIYESVLSSLFSNDSRWVVIHTAIEDTSENKREDHIGNPLIIRNLQSALEDTIDFVTEYGFDSLSTRLAFSVSDTSTGKNGLYFYSLKDKSVIAIDTSDSSSISNLVWNDNDDKLVYLKSYFNDDNKADTCDLMLWDKSLSTLAESGNAGEGWYISSANKLEWSESGKLIYFGYKKQLPVKTDPEDDSTDTDIFDFEKILSNTTLDVWHWNDPLIKTNEKHEWKNTKKHLYTAAYHLNDKKVTRLADESVPDIIHNNKDKFALGRSSIPYLKLRTWDGWYDDYYIVDIKTGERSRILEKQQGSVNFSPAGHFVLYYTDKHWYLYNVEEKSRINLTVNLDVPFDNEDHDYPMASPGYGIGGWTEDDEAVLIYDKYDIWKFDTEDGSPVNLTQSYGRNNELTLRIKDLDEEKDYFSNDEILLLTGFHNKEKYTAFYKTVIEKPGVTLILNENKKLSLIGKAEESGEILYSRETYDEFPDLWVTTDMFSNVKKLTNLDKQREPFAWGKAELLEWNSIDGIPIQGVVIKPGNYEAGKRYPVLVYYYRFFSQRVHEFNDMVINHRPNFPYYASNDYIVFLPDIRFDIGRPGYSATKCLVPGVQKLIDTGLADPEGIGLHGHSWSGYQTAFVITQTDIFACAIAGAPVSNMTSAYSGIRWGTGLARQFQYEKSQSRIGGSLWEFPERYIENSPVFFADKINTPLLIQFGDKDEAVPWYQGIELYLAMRRLEKDCVFLQYGDEPHHLKKYPNKLDYSIKMKEYLDHYCKGEPAAGWMTEGEPYIGD